MATLKQVSSQDLSALKQLFSQKIPRCYGDLLMDLVGVMCPVNTPKMESWKVEDHHVFNFVKDGVQLRFKKKELGMTRRLLNLTDNMGDRLSKKERIDICSRYALRVYNKAILKHVIN